MNQPEVAEWELPPGGMFAPDLFGRPTEWYSKNIVIQLLSSHEEKIRAEEREPLKEVLASLAEMYMQYCSDKSGHSFMSAGEGAQEILERYGLLKGANAMGGDGGIDWDALDTILSKISNKTQ